MPRVSKDCCSGCKLPKPIVNRTHWLCDDCNQMRLHGGDRRTVEKNKYKERMNSLIESRSQRTFITTIKKSTKQTAIDKKYSIIVQEITQEREEFCESCGRHGHAPLSISHIISRKRCKELGRIDLITDKRNLLIECYEPPCSYPTMCHNQWELHIIKDCIGHQTFDYKMQFIKENDPMQYSILLDKVKTIV